MSDDNRYTAECVPALCDLLYIARCRLTATVWLQLMHTNQEYRTVKIRTQSFVFIRIKRNIHTRYLKETPCTILREIYSYNRTLALLDHWQTLHHLQNSRGKKGGNQGSNKKKLCIKLICKCLYRSVEMTDISYCSSCDTARYISHQYWPRSTALLACSRQAIITTLLATGSIFFLITADSSQYALFCH